MFRGASRLFRHMPLRSVATEVRVVTIDGVGTAFDKHADAITHSLRDAFASKGIVVTLEEVGTPVIGPSIMHIGRLLFNNERIKDAYLEKHSSYPDYYTAEALHVMYGECLRRNLSRYSKPTEGLSDFLQFLKEYNIPVVLNNVLYDKDQNAIVTAHLQEHGIYFDAVITGSDVLNLSPFPDSLHKALYKTKKPAHPGEMLVYSATPMGVIAAKKGGYPSIGVGKDKEESLLMQNGARFVIPSFIEASPALLTYKAYLSSDDKRAHVRSLGM